MSNLLTPALLVVLERWRKIMLREMLPRNVFTDRLGVAMAQLDDARVWAPEVQEAVRVWVNEQIMEPLNLTPYDEVPWDEDTARARRGRIGVT